MLPKEFLDRMQQMLGEEYAAFLESYDHERYQALRLNALKKGASGHSGAEALEPGGEEAGFAHLTKVPWAEDGYYYQAEDQPGKHPYHEAGLYYIQEPSAMAPAELTGVQPGERVLDLCAAPGGKSTQIGAMLQGKGLLLCNEIHPARAKILSENIERMGIVNACVTNETPERLAEFFPEFFDCILVDAPCSGEGMFRKNDAACEEWSPENVEMCAGRQDGILDCAAGMLRPGGRLVYSTCTFAPEENEGSVERFLQRHGDFRILPVEKEKMGLMGCDGKAEWIQGILSENRAETEAGLEGTLRLWPQRVRGEGHFAALLRKAGGESGGSPMELIRGYSGENQSEVSRASNEEDSRGACRKSRRGNSGKRKGSVGKGSAEKGWKESGALEELERFCRENLLFPEENAEEGKSQKAAAVSGKRDPENVSEGRHKDAVTGRADSAVPGDREAGLAYRLGRLLGLGERAVWICFGENLYLAPAEMPPLKGLKVLRPGLHIGEIKKNRFEPSHALALALNPAYAAHKWNLSSAGREIQDYLEGGTFPAEGEKGWYLVCVDGFSTGWGKLAAGVMKNHYPKGLRKNLR